MVQPRLAVVATAARAAADGAGLDPAITRGEAGAEADAGMAVHVEAGNSPVHDLIAAIETRSLERGADNATDPDAQPRVVAGDTVPGEAEAMEPDVAPVPSGENSPAASAVLASEVLRLAEALLFAATEPVGADRLALDLPTGTDIAAVLAHLQDEYANRGVNLVKVAGKWAFRTAEDLSWALERHASEQRRLSRAALETLAIVAYHQPVTRAEIEEIRGVSISKGTLDVLMETGWVRPRGRRRAPGKPVTYGTTEAFLSHFGLDVIKDLPGLAELKGAGLLDANLPPDFKVPEPNDIAALMPDELALDAGGDDDEAQAGFAFDDPLDDDEGGLDEDREQEESTGAEASAAGRHGGGGDGDADDGPQLV